MSNSLEHLALRLIETCSHHLQPSPDGFGYYTFWVQSEEEVCPGVREALRTVSLRLVGSSDFLLLRSAIQALACTGEKVDLDALIALRTQVNPDLCAEIDEAMQILARRWKSLEELLDEVHDYRSFTYFVAALAREREAATELENAEPDRYSLNGALGWMNADISSFLYAGLSELEAGSELSQPSEWKVFARFLYGGKVYD